MAKKNLSQVDLLLIEYDNLAADSQKKLKKSKDTVSGGSSPEVEQVQAFKESMSELRDKYDQICAIARERLTESEMPPDGSPAKDFVTAVNEKKAAELAVYKDKALKVLERFVKVWSKDMDCLKPLEDHKKASGECVNALKYPDSVKLGIFKEVENYEEIVIPAETFLKALDCEDLDSEEGIELLDKVCKFFSFKTAVGLMKKQYYINEYGWW